MDARRPKFAVGEVLRTLRLPSDPAPAFTDRFAERHSLMGRGTPLDLARLLRMVHDEQLRRGDDDFALRRQQAYFRHRLAAQLSTALDCRVVDARHLIDGHLGVH